MFGRNKKKAAKALAKANTANQVVAGRQGHETISKAMKKMVSTPKNAAGVISTTFASIMANDPKSVTDAFIDMVAEDVATAAAFLALAVAATVAPKKIVEPKVAMLGIQALPAQFATGDGVNHKGMAMLGHTTMLHCLKILIAHKGMDAVASGYKASLAGAENIVAFGAGGTLPGASGKKLIRQGLLRSYAALAYSDIDTKKLAAAVTKVAKSFASLLGNAKIVWVRIRITGNKLVPEASRLAAPKAESAEEEVKQAVDVVDLSIYPSFQNADEKDQVTVQEMYGEYLVIKEELLQSFPDVGESAGVSDVFLANLIALADISRSDSGLASNVHGEWITAFEVLKMSAEDVADYIKQVQPTVPQMCVVAAFISVTP